MNRFLDVGVSTLESGIVAPVRLLIFGNFSHQYVLIPASTFIHFRALFNNVKKSDYKKIFHMILNVFIINSLFFD